MNLINYIDHLSGALTEVRDSIPEQPTGNVELRISNDGLLDGSQTRTVKVGATREEFEANAAFVFDTEIDLGCIDADVVAMHVSDLWHEWEDRVTKDRHAMLVARDSLVFGRLMGSVSEQAIDLIRQSLLSVDLGFLQWVEDCSHDVYASLCDALTAAEERLAELADAPADPKGLMGVSA